MDHDEKPIRLSDAARGAGDSGGEATASSENERSSAEPASSSEPRSGNSGKGGRKSAPRRPNRVKQERVDRMMSKAELARRAGLSVLTIDRVEKGFGCRMDTKRKILEALGMSLADRVRVFGEEE